MATAKATKKRPAPGPPDASRGRRRPRPDGLVVEVSGLAWPHRSRQNCVAMSPDADGGFASNWFAAPDIVGGVVHRFTFSADIGADAHVAKWIVRLETRAKSGLDRAIALCWWNGDQLPPEAESEAVPWSLVPCGDGAGWVTDLTGGEGDLTGDGRS
jgi:hypothetical protein